MVEDWPTYHEGELVPIDVTSPNPNGTEYDNLYLVGPRF